MPLNDLVFLSAAETAAAIRARRASPIDVVEQYLARIEALDPRLSAYITVTADGARTQARAAEKTLRGGGEQGPLFGVPIAYKDQFWTAGIRTTAGSLVHQDFIPEADATVVTRLTQAGAILVGKLSMSELALGGTRQPPFGQPRNPWNLQRTPGESSSGCGVALAANLCAASMGEDTGASGRVPASYCSAVGLRPTYSRVSRFGMMASCWFLDQAAPMTKSVEDSALLLRAIAGYDVKDPSTSRRPVPDYLASLRGGVKGLRIGVIRELQDHDAMSDEIRSAIEDSMETYARLGAVISEVSIPMIARAGSIYSAIADPQAAMACDGILRSRAEDLDSASRTRLQAASLLPAKVHGRAMQARTLLRRQFTRALDDVDLLLSATSPESPGELSILTAAFADGENHPNPSVRRSYTCSYALAAMPAISVPCGFTPDGIPIGLQLGARPFGEAMLLRAAHAFERSTDWHLRQASWPEEQMALAA